MAKNLVYDVHETPKFNKLIIFALQQLLAILAATIAVPSIIGLPTQIPAAIFGAGIGTLVYQLFTRFKSPVFLGSSFAFLNSLAVAITYGYCGIVLGSIVAGLVYVAIALVIHFVGTDWVAKLMPPVIIGPTVALIGLSLAVNAMGDITKANASTWNQTYNLVALLCGLVTFATVVICSTQKKFTMPKLIPFILGIGAGYITAWLFTIIGILTNCDYLMIVDWSGIKANFVDQSGEFTGLSAFLTAPKFALFEGIKELMNGEVGSEIMKASKSSATVITWGGVAEVLIAFLPVALVVFAEHIADHKNLSTIIEKDLIKEPGLKRTLLGDGVGSIAGTLLGICPNTTYGESVGCVAITKNASVFTITVTAIMCIVLSFISPIMVILQSIPSCVMGGVCLTLYGFIAVSGLKMFKEVDLSENKNLFVVSAILIAGIGGLTIQIPYTSEIATVFFVDYSSGAAELASKLDGFTKVIKVTPIATALILGIVTNFVLGKIEKSKFGKEPEETKEIAE